MKQRLSSYLRQLEAESIHIMREVVAEFRNPVMLYSIGKDSSVLLHLAMKAFYPAKPPFPLLHVDTTWKFREMIAFRDRMAQEHHLDLTVHTNAEGRDEGVTPFTHGAHEYTRIMKTVALREALDQGGYDAAFGGARRDEERSRAKERMFSLREPGHRWEPRKQRPEFWRTANTQLSEGQTMRVFPMSNWTELDVWRYIQREQIEVVPLYFSKERPVVERDGQLIMVDDDRFPLQDGEKPQMRSVRFRTLGCYPLTAAVESTADNLDDLLAEMLVDRRSERAGRLIDGEGGGSMESKKTEGYF
jgi:sulfate adenylyltransferase subunit 2